MALVLCIIAFLASLVAGRHSRVGGLVTTIGIGYVYGIVRANVPEAASHFIFDSAVLGFYITQFSYRFSLIQQQKILHLKPWVEFLIFWPVMLFFIPIQDWLVQLIGLRGSVFLLPFLFIGAWLEPEERYRLALWLAAFNIAAFVVACVEFLVGVEPFFPRNDVTYLIYKSKDLVGHRAYRIPSFFNNSHAYAGAVLVTLPLLLGALVQKHKRIWAGKVLMLALVATLLGIFLTGARMPVVIAGLVVVVATFSLRSRIGYAMGWLIILFAVGWIVSGEERLQRFTQLGDTEAVGERLSGSVNMGFIELVQTYPFGNGLGGGGTSMPYWLRNQVKNPVLMENEYARIMLEQGIIGLILWITFLIWALTRYRADKWDKWALGKKLAWVASVGVFIASVIGTGTFTAIPQTCILLLLLGWVTGSQQSQEFSRSRLDTALSSLRTFNTEKPVRERQFS